MTPSRRVLSGLALGLALGLSTAAVADDRPFWETIGLTSDEWVQMELGQRQLLLDAYQQNPEVVLRIVEAYRARNPLPGEGSQPGDASGAQDEPDATRHYTLDELRAMPFWRVMGYSDAAYGALPTSERNALLADWRVNYAYYFDHALTYGLSTAPVDGPGAGGEDDDPPADDVAGGGDGGTPPTDGSSGGTPPGDTADNGGSPPDGGTPPADNDQICT